MLHFSSYHINYGLYSGIMQMWKGIYNHLKQIVFSKRNTKIKYPSWAFYMLSFYFNFHYYLLFFLRVLFAMPYIWRLEDDFVESVHSFHLYGFWRLNSDHVARVFLLLSHLDSPAIQFFIYISISALINTDVNPVLVLVFCHVWYITTYSKCYDS